MKAVVVGHYLQGAVTATQRAQAEVPIVEVTVVAVEIVVTVVEVCSIENSIVSVVRSSPSGVFESTHMVDEVGGCVM